MNNTLEKTENKEGYKKTKLGWIPEGWEVSTYEQILKKSYLGGNYQNTEEKTSKPLIKMGNVIREKISLKKLEYIPENEKAENIHILKKDDLLLNTRNALNLVGKVSIWNNELPLAYFNSNLLKMIFKSEVISSNYFMNYSFNSYYALKQMRARAIGSTSVAAVYERDLNSIKFIIPSLKEQQKIAEVLTKWDDGIEATKKLIATKQKSKKALMQRLLTGKIRFPEFAGQEWKTYKLNNCLISVIREKQKPSSKYLALGIRSHCKGTFLKPDFDPNKIDMTTLYEVKKNDLIVNITFAWEGAIAIVKKEDDGALVSHRFPTFITNKTIASTEYFRHYIKQRSLVFKLGLISPGGAGRNRVMSKKSFIKLPVSLPSIEEQQKIAAVLNACDRDIELLKQKLNTLNEQKKGLMQKLLTGEIRVKMDKEAG